MRLMKIFNVMPIPDDEGERSKNPSLDELLRRIDASTMRNIADQAHPDNASDDNGIRFANRAALPNFGRFGYPGWCRS